MVFNDSKFDSRFNLSANLLVDLKPVAFFSFAGKENVKSREYDKVFLKGHVEFCQISSGFLGNLVTQIAVDLLSKYSNLKIECPIAKGFYYINGFPVIDQSSLPYNYLGLAGRWECLVTLKMKLPKGRNLVQVLKMRIEGETCV